MAAVANTTIPAATTYNIADVQQLVKTSSIAVNMALITFIMKNVQQGYKAVAEARVKVYDEHAPKLSDEKVKRVYSMLFHASAEIVMNMSLSHKIMEEMQKTAGELAKKFIPSFVLGEVPNLIANLKVKAPASLDDPAPWAVSAANIEKYKALNV